VRAAYDYDWLIVGSGFGGSVSAMRLTERGYSVGMLECGRRFEDEDFVKTTWNLWRYYWVPKLRMKGIQRLTLFNDILIASAAVLRHRRADAGSGRSTAARVRPTSCCATSARSSACPRPTTARASGCSSTTTPRARPSATPTSAARGPERAGCVRCGSCMPGCRYNAKNTLPKNYLFFAERNGARVHPERTVTDVRPLGAADGSEGYAVTSERSGRWVARDRQTHTARGVIVAAGPIGTNQLLMSCRHQGSLPRISKRLGYRVRTNSESIAAVTVKNDRLDFTKSVAISSSIHPAEDTHIENVTYGPGADSMASVDAARREGQRGSRGRCGSSPAPRATRSSSRARPGRTGSRAAR